MCVPVQIILYTAKDHPHHSLYIILAMGNATKDDEYPPRGYVCGSRKGKSRRAGTGGGGGSHSVDEVRRPCLLDSQLQPWITVDGTWYVRTACTLCKDVTYFVIGQGPGCEGSSC